MPLFSRDLSLSESLSKCNPKEFFKLNIAGDYPYCEGKSLQLVEERIASQESYGYLGFLIGYAYMFGMQDLHFQNMFLLKNIPVVLDVEVVFSDLVLPSETQILPFKDTLFEKSGISSIFKKEQVYNKDAALIIIDGYLAICEVFNKKRKSILKILNSYQEIINEMPIRVIFRNTSDYKNNSYSDKNPLFTEEKIQLSRGDVPYFYKKMVGRDIFWLSGKNNWQKVCVPNYYESYSEKCGKDYSTLLDANKINEKTINGLMYLVRHLMPLDFNGRLISKYFKCKLDEREIEVFFKKNEYIVNRVRPKNV